MDFKESYLWNASIANSKYGHDEKREHLIDTFLDARENAKSILSKIREDFPNLTVHDITHVDGLWNVASVITGQNYDINPLEGFVLGCAFLMHDAVMSYDAFGGKNSLRQTNEWNDFRAVLNNNNTLSSDDKDFEADFKTIRYLHGKKAEELYKQLFDRNDGSRFFIIEDRALREHYGEIICKIAGSHHWDIDKVEELGTQFSATTEYPREWRINPIKLACILRCADAGHIDDGRAPDHLLELLRVNGVSRNHWVAQNRLSQIDVDDTDSSKVVIKSNISFKEEDFAAWNVAFDAVQVLDKELKASNELLKLHSTQEFQAKSVSGAHSRETLCQHIKADGWVPCEADIHISNVESLINSIGGEKLYGKDHKLEIVLRELIQNSRDAIVARRKLDPEYVGKINVQITQDGNETWVSVKDDGVGMSIQTIKNHFLNFGSSFWMSDLAIQEYPGLNSSGFKSLGQFGIGFYSIFMVASKVIVETRKYSVGLEAIQLKFPSGLCLRPIVSKMCMPTTSVSTEVRFLIDSEKCCWKNTYSMNRNSVYTSEFIVPYSSVLSNIVAGLDVDVYYKELGNENKLIHKNIDNIEEGSLELAEWLKDITYSRYRDDPIYSYYIDNNYKRVRKIIYDGEFYGIAALNTLFKSDTFFEIHTIGGLSLFSNTSHNAEYLGFLISEPETARRDIGGLTIDLKEWAQEQYGILSRQGLSDLDKLYLPYIVGKYGIDMTDDMLITLIDKTGELKVSDLKSSIIYMAKEKINLVLALSTIITPDRIENNLDYEISKSKLNANELLYRTINNSGFLNINLEDKYFPLNLYKCIDIVSKKLGLTMNHFIEEKKAYSIFTGECRGLVLSFESSGE